MKYLILDFNGTVLDDVDVSMNAINTCVKQYLKRSPISKDEYLHIFTFPIKSYYEAAGFDWNGYTYEEVGLVWFNYYMSHKDEYKLFDGIIELINKAKAMDYKIVLLSASSLIELQKQLDELKITEYFDEVLGINNIYAKSKIEIAKSFIKGKNPDDCIFVGDTLHDLQSAEAMGIKNIYLFSKGHQARDILEGKCKKVIDKFDEVQL